MKKISSIIILLFIAFNISSQNIETEIRYLKTISKQGKKLVKDNLRNAEICAYKLVKNPDSFSSLGGYFLKELAKSYFITENYEFALLTYFRQRCFFPEQENGEVSKYYINAAERIKDVDYKFLSELYKNTDFDKVPKSYNERYILFLKTIYQTSFKKTNRFEITYSDLYRSTKKESDIPYWIMQHNFYSKIGIKPEKRSTFYSFDKVENDFFIPDFFTKKQKQKTCNKALKYYLHSKNKTKVKEYVKFCKENDINYCFRAKLIR